MSLDNLAIRGKVACRRRQPALEYPGGACIHDWERTSISFMRSTQLSIAGSIVSIGDLNAVQAFHCKKAADKCGNEALNDTRLEQN